MVGCLGTSWASLFRDTLWWNRESNLWPVRSFSHVSPIRVVDNRRSHWDSPEKSGMYKSCIVMNVFCKWQRKMHEISLPNMFPKKIHVLTLFCVAPIEVGSQRWKHDELAPPRGRFECPVGWSGINWQVDVSPFHVSICRPATSEHWANKSLQMRRGAAGWAVADSGIGNSNNSHQIYFKSIS